MARMPEDLLRQVIAARPETIASPRDYSITFGGAGVREIRAAGRFLRLLEVPSSAVFVSVGGGSELKRVAGQGVDYGGKFDRFRVRSTVAQTVLIVVSDTPQDDAQQTVNANVTATVAPGNTLSSPADGTVGAGLTATVLAADVLRLGVLVKALTGNASAVRIGAVGEVGAAAGHELDPGDSVFIASTAAIEMHNPGAGAQSVCFTVVREV